MHIRSISHFARKLLLISVLFSCPGAAAYAGSVTSDPQSTDPEFPPGMWTGSIPSGDAGFNYIAYLADGKGPHPFVILLHGFPGNEKNLDLAQALRRTGWNVLYMNFRGTWGSPGSYSVENANQDVASAISYLRDPQNFENLRTDGQTIAVIGHSFGGFNALYTAAHHAEVSCVAGMAFSDIGHQLRRHDDPERAVWPWIRARDIVKGYTREIAIEEFVRNRDAFYVMEFGERLASTPTLLVIPEFDGESSVQRQLETAEKFEAAGVDVTTKLIKGADHAFSARRIELAKTVSDWLASDCLKAQTGSP